MRISRSLKSVLCLTFFFIHLAWLFSQNQSENLSPDVQISVDKDSITVGDLINLSLIVTHSPELVVSLPGSDAKVGEFDIREHRAEGPIELETGALKSSVFFVLTAFQTGDLEIPPLLVSYTDALGSIGEVKTEPIVIHIKSVLSEDSQEIQDLKPPLSMPRDWIPLIILVGASLLILGVLFYLYRKYWKKIHSKAKVLSAGPEQPPHQIALDQLRRLKESGLINQDAGHFHTMVSEIVRQYIEERYRIDALEMTSGEVLSEYSKKDRTGETTSLLEDFLIQCDLVKFARHQPKTLESEKTLERAFRFVDQTKPTPVSLEPSKEVIQ